MTTQVITETSIHEAVLTTINTPPSPDNTYRYYICHTNWINELICNKVSAQYAESKVNNTRIVCIKKYIPEVFDPLILKKRWTPTKVTIK